MNNYCLVFIHVLVIFDCHGMFSYPEHPCFVYRVLTVLIRPVADYYGLSDLLDLVTLAGGFKCGWSGSEQTNMKGLVCPHSLENTCYKCFVVCWISFTV